MDGSGIGRMVSNAVIVIFILGAIAGIALLGLGWLAIYIFHHLHWS